MSLILDNHLVNYLVNTISYRNITTKTEITIGEKYSCNKYDIANIDYPDIDEYKADLKKVFTDKSAQSIIIALQESDMATDLKEQLIQYISSYIVIKCVYPILKKLNDNTETLGSLQIKSQGTYSEGNKSLEKAIKVNMTKIDANTDHIKCIRDDLKTIKNDTNGIAKKLSVMDEKINKIDDKFNMLSDFLDVIVKKK